MAIYLHKYLFFLYQWMWDFALPKKTPSFYLNIRHLNSVSNVLGFFNYPFLTKRHLLPCFVKIEGVPHKQAKFLSEGQ